jgi:glycine/D-amino acid oxidase-like deaminating enzyme
MAILGAGFTGLWTALYLPLSLDVTLLKAGHFADLSPKPRRTPEQPLVEIPA